MGSLFAKRPEPRRTAALMREADVEGEAPVLILGTSGRPSPGLPDLVGFTH
jgi:hypothetical protein